VRNNDFWAPLAAGLIIGLAIMQIRRHEEIKALIKERCVPAVEQAK
jgi:hypothetical protein